jgi:hypothetical protein
MKYRETELLLAALEGKHAALDDERDRDISSCVFGETKLRTQNIGIGSTMHTWNK